MDNWIEIKRQSFHAFFLVLFALLIYLNILNVFHFLLILILGFLLSLICRKVKLPVLHWFLRHFERPKLIRVFPGQGALTAVLGVLIVFIIFSEHLHIVAAALLILGLGDSLATVIGRTGGRRHPLNPKKSIRGSFSGIIAGFLGAWAIPGITIPAAALGAFAGMLAEAINLDVGFKIDDNISVPLISSLAIYAVLCLA